MKFFPATKTSKHDESIIQAFKFTKRHSVIVFVFLGLERIVQLAISVD